MQNADLSGRSILIVEDEPLLAIVIAQAFESAGAKVTTTNALRHALALIETHGLSAAVLDHALSDGNSTALCTRLKERAVPFVIYSGMPDLEGPCTEVPLIDKPADPFVIVEKIADLLKAG
jgi:DNA-binding response OmpR family regulator